MVFVELVSFCVHILFYFQSQACVISMITGSQENQALRTIGHYVIFIHLNFNKNKEVRKNPQRKVNENKKSFQILLQVSYCKESL